MAKTGEKQAAAPGQWRKGQSGNPHGRPKGSRNKTTEFCASLLGDDADAIMQRLIKDAKKGEPVALRLAVERLLPARGARDRAVTMPAPAVLQAADLAAAAGEVIGQAAAGNLTLSEAREFMALIESRRKTIETAELSVRIEALESAGVGPGRDGAAAPEPAAGQDLARRVRRLIVGEEGQ